MSRILRTSSQAVITITLANYTIFATYIKGLREVKITQDNWHDIYSGNIDWNFSSRKDTIN